MSDPRPAARPDPQYAPRATAPSPPKPKRPFWKRAWFWVVLIALTITSLAVAGSIGEKQREHVANQAAEQEFQVEIKALKAKLASSCIEKVHSELEPSIQGARVTSWDSTTSTYKLNGAYSGGEFACVLDGKTELVNTAIIYPSDSDVRSWVRER